MYPHRINLTGPWELQAEGKSFRVTFPWNLQQHPELQRLDGPIKLRRFFRWPTALMPFECLWLTVNSAAMSLKGIYLNSQLLGDHNLPFVPWTHDISALVQHQNVLELSLSFLSSMPYLGFCGPNYLEVRRQVHLTDIYCETQWHEDRPLLKLSARAEGKSERPLALVIRLNNEEVYYREFPELTQTTDRLQVTIPLLKTMLWQPGEMNALQTLELHLLDPACLLDQHTYPIGFRKVQRLDEQTYQINGCVMNKIVIHELDEPISESPKLECMDREGSSIILRIPAAATFAVTYLPFIWQHPCIVDYSFASSSIASRKP